MRIQIEDQVQLSRTYCQVPVKHQRTQSWVVMVYLPHECPAQTDIHQLKYKVRINHPIPSPSFKSFPRPAQPSTCTPRPSRFRKLGHTKASREASRVQTPATLSVQALRHLPTSQPCGRLTAVQQQFNQQQWVNWVWLVLAHPAVGLAWVR